MWNIFEVNNKETRTTAKRHSKVFIVNFEHALQEVYISTSPFADCRDSNSGNQKLVQFIIRNIVREILKIS